MSEVVASDIRVYPAFPNESQREGLLNILPGNQRNMANAHHQSVLRSLVQQVRLHGAEEYSGLIREYFTNYLNSFQGDGPGIRTFIYIPSPQNTPTAPELLAQSDLGHMYLAMESYAERGYEP